MRWMLWSRLFPKVTPSRTRVVLLTLRWWDLWPLAVVTVLSLVVSRVCFGAPWRFARADLRHLMPRRDLYALDVVVTLGIFRALDIIAAYVKEFAGRCRLKRAGLREKAAADDLLAAMTQRLWDRMHGRD